MFDPETFEEISARIAEVIAARPTNDLGKNTQSTMAVTFAQHDVTMREEVGVQRRVLQSARKKLAALEARLVQMDMLGAGPGRGS